MLNCQKHLFDLPEDISYLNCAYMGPFLKDVSQVGQIEVQKKLRPFQYTIADFFEPMEQLKNSFAQLINCSDPQRIALIPAASYGIANAAANIDFSKKKTILVVGEQFPSNIYSWQRLAEQKGAIIKIVTAPSKNENRTEVWNQSILDNINEDTAVVSMAHVHWADGTLFDLKTIRKKTTSVDAFFILDGTQSIGALPFDVKNIQPDALICGSYKWLLGPYGLGLAYYGPRFDHGNPIEDNWINRKESENFANLVNYQSEYKPKAARYSVGEQSNFIYVPMLNASINQLLDWQPERIQAYCKNLVAPLIPSFESLGCSVASQENMAFHLFGIRMPEGIDILKLKTQLDLQKVFISIRGNAIRVSPNVYNETKDLEKLLACLKAVLI